MYSIEQNFKKKKKKSFTGNNVTYNRKIAKDIYSIKLKQFLNLLSELKDDRQT